MLKSNKWKLLISSIIILLPTLFGLFVKDKVMGVAGGYYFLLALPVILLAIHWLCLLITAHDNRYVEQSKKVIGMVFWIIPAISLYANGIIYATMLGLKLNFFALVMALLGIAFILIGNYLPKTTRNRTIGIKIKWTLANDENWNATHRFGGKVSVCVGLACLLSVFLPSVTFPFVAIAIIAVDVILPTVYSYRFYKKQLREGTATAEDYKNADVYSGKHGKLVAVISIVLVALILIFCVVICFTGSVNVEYGEASFTVKATYWSDLTLNYADIDAIEYRESGVSGERINGFGSPRLLLGWFTNDEFGNHTRYTYTECKPCVVLTVDGETVVIGGEDVESTRAIYDTLSAKISE